MSDSKVPSQDELKTKLDPMSYKVTQEAATEAPFSGKYWNEHADGSYHCVVCGQKLFEAETKFDSHSGWPSFDSAIPGSVREITDNSGGMHRTEVVCNNCGAHLGHVFGDGPKETTGQRFCINSAALDLHKKADKTQ